MATKEERAAAAAAREQAAAEAKAAKEKAKAEAEAAKAKAAAEKAKADAKAAKEKAAAEAKAAKEKAAAEKAAAREQVKAAKAAETKAKAEAREAARAAAREARLAQGGTIAMQSLVERAKAGLYVKGAQGQLRANDDIAVALDVVPTEKVVDACMTLLGESANKYASLNYGQQSMNYRNRLRGAVRKSVEVGGVPLTIERVRAVAATFAA